MHKEGKQVKVEGENFKVEVVRESHGYFKGGWQKASQVKWYLGSEWNK